MLAHFLLDVGWVQNARRGTLWRKTHFFDDLKTDIFEMAVSLKLSHLSLY